MATSYILGPFRLDPEAEILFRGAEPVALGIRAVAVLRVLVERPGVPVSKDALIEAAWAGLTVEESNLTVQIAALRRVFGETAGGADWIETLARRGYRFVGPVSIEEQGAGGAPLPASGLSAAAGVATPTLPNRPSIAVLPFQNMSGDPEQEYFADGMVEEIITALSRFRSLFVIARNSSFTYKGRPVDVKQVGRELGVRYVLEGSVRRAASRVRIIGQLIDASTSAHLWADRFEGGLEDVFDLQDQVTTSIVGAIAPKLEHAEIERAKRKPTESLDAYDYYLHGMAGLYQFTSREANTDALQHFKRAVEVDPDFASAYGMAASCYVPRKANSWMVDVAKETAEAARLAQRAMELGGDDALVLTGAGTAFAYVARDLDAGASLIDRSLLLNANLARAWFWGGYVKLWLGEPDAAIDRFAHVMRLSPIDPYMPIVQAAIADAHFHAGRYDEASSWGAMSIRGVPFHNGLRIVAASNALAGRLDQARVAMERLRQLDPDLRVSTLRDIQGPYRRTDDIARYEDAMHKAGLPD